MIDNLHEKSNIDIVLIWVDGNDKEWQKSKASYCDNSIDIDASINRYRDWDNLQYIFRGIEKFMPWVNIVHFITCGHVPVWLNTNHPKLNFVKHEDYIPAKYLPTFSSHPIELNLHRIRELSNKFIYFNDDTFVVNTTQKTDFFNKEGLPLDMAIHMRITSTDYTDPIAHIALNNTAVINSHFNKKAVMCRDWKKWFHPSYGITNLIRSSTFLPYPNFTGFLNTHLPASFLKSTFKDVWCTEPEIMDAVSTTKFRSKSDINQYLMRDWQIVNGDFSPKNWYKEGKYYGVSIDTINEIERDIISQQYKLICLNDVATDDTFDNLKHRVKKALEAILPDKSGFEL